MMDDHGFVGVPRETFEIGGRLQFMRLLENGLLPESKVLDIGCGVLRVGYWLIRFLDPNSYCGIDPARDRIEMGMKYLFSSEELARSRPRFDSNSTFDTSVFSETFDFFLAGSIWTHCSKGHLERTLDGFVAHTRPGAVFLASYLPAGDEHDDYRGAEWVGTSHESSTPGVIRHSLDWIQGACDCRGLRWTMLAGVDCDSQPWMRVEKAHHG